MTLKDFIKKNGIKFQYVHIVYAKRDKDNDDFHILPSPVISYAHFETLTAYSFGFKWGFWGIALSFAFIKNIDISEVQ